MSSTIIITTTTPTTATRLAPTAKTMSTTSRTITTRRISAPRVPLAARAHIDMHDKGLHSISGAQEIIFAIRSRKTVTKLILGHNALGSDGTRELFRFLCSDEGRRYRIVEISLNANGIGNDGLEAVSEYLEGNESLRELFLQNNAFQGNAEIATKLSHSINTSSLSLLSLASNQTLSDAFLIPFLTLLASPTLRELQISAIGLTSKSAPALMRYLTKKKSRAGALEILKCNGNALGARAVRRLVGRLRMGNFTLLKVEVYANAAASVDTHPHPHPHEPGHLSDLSEENDTDNPGDDDDDDERDLEREESVEEARAKWTKCEQEMKNVMVRNDLLRRKVHEEALRLLTVARVVLLCSSSSSTSSERDRERTDATSVGCETQKEVPTTGARNTSSTSTSPPSPSSDSPSSPTPTFFPFRALPTELQQSILALLAPSLSAPQRARIFSFAADPATLRHGPLLPSLLRGSSSNSNSSRTGIGMGGAGFGGAGGRGCIPDPASLPFGSLNAPGSGSGLSLPMSPGSPGLGLGPLSPPISQTFSLNADAGTRLGLLSSPSSSPSLPSSPPRHPLLSSSPLPPPSGSITPTASPPYTPSLGLCSSGRCMNMASGGGSGSGVVVLCHRAEVRMRWLAMVGCTRFDPDDGRGEGEVLRLLGEST